MMRLNFYSSVIAGMDNALTKARRVEGSYIRNLELDTSEYVKLITELNAIKDRDIQMEYKRRFKVKHIIKDSDDDEYTVFNFFNPTEEFCHAWVENQITVTYIDYDLVLVPQQVNNKQEDDQQE